MVPKKVAFSVRLPKSDPCGDAAGWWFILDPAPDFRVVKTLQDGL
jgi:hypothetical protein